MPFAFGTVTEFSDANSIGDPVIEALARAIELPRFTGAVYQRMRAPIAPIDNKQFDIYSRSATTKNGIIGTAAAGDWGGTSGVAALPIPAAYIAGLSLGHVIQVDNEVLIISGVNRGSNTISVFGRGAGGTTAATHSTGAAFKVIGFAGRDADLKNVTASNEAALKYTNYVQTVFEVLDWEYGATLKRKGLSDANVITVLQKEAAIRVAQNLSVMAVQGVKQAGVSGGTPYMSAGLLSQLIDTAGGTRPVLRYNAAAALTEPILRGALMQVFDRGSPDIIICSLSNYEKFLTFNGAGKDVTIATDRQDKGAGRSVTYYEYGNSRLDLVVDAAMPSDRMVVATSADLQKGWLMDDALRTVTEPTLSSRERRESIQGSVGFIVENVGYSHIDIYGLA